MSNVAELHLLKQRMEAIEEYVVLDRAQTRQEEKLRDQFAEMAMQALIIAAWERNGDTNYIVDNDGRLSLHLRAYEHADAMLLARGEK